MVRGEREMCVAQPYGVVHSLSQVQNLPKGPLPKGKPLHTHTHTHSPSPTSDNKDSQERERETVVSKCVISTGGYFFKNEFKFYSILD